MEIEVKLLNDIAQMPSRAHATDAGADIRACEHAAIMPGEYKTVSTGVSVKIPPKYVGLAFSKSGQGIKGISLANSVGVIDSDYRGELKATIRNDSDIVYNIFPGDKIFQLVVVPIALPKFVEPTGDWNDTVRGTGGFGSTGVK